MGSRSVSLLWALGLSAVLTTFSPPARAEDAQMRAAAEFELGLKLYERGDLAKAAAAFLRADMLSPSEDAIRNAITAAKKARDHLTTARASTRAIERASSSRELAKLANEALAQASPHLARVELGCQPAPCELVLDEERVQAGEQWVLPGTHRVIASAGEARAERELTLEAGSAERAVLTLKAESVEAPPPPSEAPPAKHPVKDAVETERPLPPAVFYAGAAVTLVLAGVTTWSGLDTLRARDDLPRDPTKRQVEDVRTRVRRTDFLLAGTLVAAAGTTAAGLFWVDFSGGEAKRSGTLGLFASGRF